MRSPSQRVRVLFLVVAASLVASACSAVAPESLAFEDDVASRQTVIRIAATSADTISDAIAAWELEHPTTDVVIDVRPPDEHHALMLESRAAGNAPDIVMIDADHTTAFRNQTEIFANLVPLGGADLEENFIAWRWEQGLADDGAVIAVPINAGGLALAYRSDLLGQNLSKDLEEATGWCDVIAVGDRYADHTRRAFLPEADGLFEAILDQAPVRFHNSDGALIHSTNPAVRTAWDTTMRALGERPMFEDPCPEHTDILRISANLTAGSNEWDEAIRTDRFAATLVSSTALNAIQTTAPETAGSWRLTDLPGNQSGNSGGAHLAVHIDSSHQALAFDLVAYLADPATQLDAFIAGGPFPAASTIYADDALLDHRNPFFGDSAIGQVFRSSVRNYVVAPEGPEHQLILDEYRAAVSRVESGTQTPQEAWNEAQWRIDLFLR